MALFGVGTTDVLGRLATSLGGLQAVAPSFQHAKDVPYGGVLLALPALLACGLLSEVDEHFQLPKGYYSLQSIFLLLALMALARIKTIEDLRYCAPGEWGKLIGLDRIPEVRTLRHKLKALSHDGLPEKWGAYLCRKWMQSDTQASGVFYIDGPDTTRVTNPAYRELDGTVRRLAAKHSRELAEFGSMHLDGDIEPKEIEAYELKKANLLEGIQARELELAATKEQRKAIDRHIPISQLPEEERFKRLAIPRKHLIDTIKMVAYRAETAMANVLLSSTIRTDERRTLLRSIYQTEADILPDYNSKTLTIKLHHLANHASDKSLQHLCEELNETKTLFPGTPLQLIYKVGAV